MRGILGSSVRILAILACAGALVLVGQSADARPDYFQGFVAAYPQLLEPAKAAKCNVCHFGNVKKNRNDYGLALAKALGGKKKNAQEVAQALKEVEGNLSPEGKTYAARIHAGKLPGQDPVVRALVMGIVETLLGASLAAPEVPLADVTPWVAKLRSADARERCEAATALARLGPAARAAIDDLLLATADRDRNVRFVAAEALEEVSTPEEQQAFEPLVARLQALGAAADHPARRAEAIRKLGVLGPEAARATPAIVRELAGEAVVRYSAVRALAAIGEGAIAGVPELGKIVEKGSPEDAHEAAMAISRISATDGLFPRKKPAEIAEAEGKALALLVKALSGESRGRRVDAARALSRFGPQAREYTPQLTALLDFDDAELVYAGARALASISHESRAMLDKVAYVVDENSKLEGKATRVAVALSRLYQEMPRFEDSLMNGTLVEQMEAARVMSTVDAVAAGIPWRDRLAEAAKSPRAHRAAIVGLGRLALSDNNWAGIEALDKKISSPDVEIRLAAVEMLGDLLEAENFNPRAGVRVSLKQFLTDPSPDVRAAAARKLAPPKP